MRYYNIEVLRVEYKNIDIINKYYVEDTFFAVAENFIDGWKINSTQKILGLKYSAVAFNIYTSIYYLEEYWFKCKDKFQELINIQSSNFYLQAAYDNLYQLLNFMSLSEQENKELYNNDKKRYNKEKTSELKILNLIMKIKKLLNS